MAAPKPLKIQVLGGHPHSKFDFDVAAM